MIFTVDDEDGILALVDASRYVTFVGADWTYESLLDHFRSQMADKAILVWECGDGGNDYRIKVRDGLTDQPGFRSATGTISAGSGQLHLASYTALTMAAQFDDEVIPSRHEADLTFPVSSDNVRVRIIQNFDPAVFDDLPESLPHFIIEVEPGDALAWRNVQWETVEAAAPPPTEDSVSEPATVGWLAKLLRPS